MFSFKSTLVHQISTQHIVSNRAQPRKEFNESELNNLAQSIEINGIIQPLTVRKMDKSVKYELIAGERRLRAAVMRGLPTVPCIIVTADDRKSAILALTENIQRTDLHFFEEAQGIANLIESWNITQEEAARRLGKRQSTVANKLRLLRLSSEERLRILQEQLTERHARALLRLNDTSLRMQVIEEIASDNMNVSETERLIEKMNLGIFCAKKHGTQKFVLRDVRIFMNTVSKAINTMRQSGIDADAVQNETDDFIEYVVRISKKSPVNRAG